MRASLTNVMQVLVNEFISRKSGSPDNSLSGLRSNKRPHGHLLRRFTVEKYLLSLTRERIDELSGPPRTLALA